MIKSVKLPPIQQDFELEDEMIKIRHTIAVEYIKHVDEIILKSIYETYKGMADEVIVIDETKFKEFVFKYLPIYLKDQEREVEDE